MSSRHRLAHGEVLAFYDFISQAFIQYLLRAGRSPGTLCVLGILKLDPRTGGPPRHPEPGEPEAEGQSCSGCHPGAGMENSGPISLTWVPWPCPGG